MNSAEFSNGSLEEEADAFDIIVTVFDELLQHHAGGELASYSVELCMVHSSLWLTHSALN